MFVQSFLRGRVEKYLEGKGHAFIDIFAPNHAPPPSINSDSPLIPLQLTGEHTKVRGGGQMDPTLGFTSLEKSWDFKAYGICTFDI